MATRRKTPNSKTMHQDNFQQYLTLKYNNKKMTKYSNENFPSHTQ